MSLLMMASFKLYVLCGIAWIVLALVLFITERLK